MPTYRYRALDPDGVKYASTIDADSLPEAIEAIRAKELVLEAIEPADDPLPSPPGQTSDPSSAPRLEPAAPRPPSAPRDVPPKSLNSAGGLVFLFVGGLFTLVAAIFIIVGLGMVISGENSGWFFVLFPMIHLVIGLGLLRHAIKTRTRRRDVIANGLETLGRIETVGYNRKVSINGRNPFKITYSYDVDGTGHTGKRSTMNTAITEHELHDRIWVLYDPQDPSSSVEWPPL